MGRQRNGEIQRPSACSPDFQLLATTWQQVKTEPAAMLRRQKGTSFNAAAFDAAERN
jgi:hypothetical protein